MNNVQNKPNKLIIIFWTISFSGDRFIPETFENAYKVLMKLTILSVDIADLGLLYKCVAKNSLGDTDGAIKLYRKYILLTFFLIFLILNWTVLLEFQRCYISIRLHKEYINFVIKIAIKLFESNNVFNNFFYFNTFHSLCVIKKNFYIPKIKKKIWYLNIQQNLSTKMNIWLLVRTVSEV